MQSKGRSAALKAILDHYCGRYVTNSRCYGVEVAPSSKGRDPEWDSAKPYEQIPRMTFFQALKNFVPGGKCYSSSFTSKYSVN